ncbi:MAG: hypothetical protein ABWK15_04265 [Dissulfuribacterales bacterium]
MAEQKRLSAVKEKRYPSLAAVSNYGNCAGSGMDGREEVWGAGVIVCFCYLIDISFITIDFSKI